MSEPLQRLLRDLTPQPIETARDTLVGQSFDPGWGQLFGGQVFAQAIAAADTTRPAERALHMAHGDFLRRGDVAAPVTYEVERTRDGRSFSFRRVTARQHGHVILTLSCSYQHPQEGVQHTEPAPQPPGPETLPSPTRSVRASEALDLRVVEPVRLEAPQERPPHRQLWLRTRQPMTDDADQHRVLLAYTSDFHMLTTSLQPHAMTWLTPGVRAATLHHTIWFHRPFRIDDWLLHDITSPSAAGGRAMTLGRIFTSDGLLVANTAQQGVLRTPRDH